MSLSNCSPSSVRASMDSLHESEDELDLTTLFSNTVPADMDGLAEAKNILATIKENTEKIDKLFTEMQQHAANEVAKFNAEIQLKNENIDRLTQKMHQVTQVNTEERRIMEKNIQEMVQIGTAKDVFMHKIFQNVKTTYVDLEMFLMPRNTVNEPNDIILLDDDAADGADQTNENVNEHETTEQGENADESFADARETIDNETQSTIEQNGTGGAGGAGGVTDGNKENETLHQATDPLAVDEPQFVFRKYFTCKFCKEPFAKKKDLRRHKAIDHKIPQKKKIEKQIKRKRESSDDESDDNDENEAVFLVKSSTSVLRAQDQNAKKGKKVRKLLMLNQA